MSRKKIRQSNIKNVYDDDNIPSEDLMINDIAEDDLPENEWKAEPRRDDLPD